MPNPLPLAKARLLELDVSMNNEQPGGKQRPVVRSREGQTVS